MTSYAPVAPIGHAVAVLLLLMLLLLQALVKSRGIVDKAIVNMDALPHQHRRMPRSPRATSDTAVYVNHDHASGAPS
jgi:hypothetical protein